MFSNYLKVAWRNIVRHKGYSFINIVGLAIGMACCMLIMLWVVGELSYDRFHTNADRIHRLIQQRGSSDRAIPEAMSPGPLGPALQTEVPSIEAATRLRFTSDGLPVRSGETSFVEKGICYADPSMLDMFTFPLFRGNSETALVEPNSIVISREAAQKYFGDSEPMGKVLTLNDRFEFAITGVLEEIPANSHLQFDFLVPFSTLKQWGRSVGWGDWSYYTYVTVSPGFPLQEVNRQVNECLRSHFPEVTSEYYVAQVLEDIHLHSSHLAWDIGGHGNIAYVRFFTVLAVFVLIVACINFMNLATARSRLRAREIGVRKAVGASRGGIIRQFFAEAILSSFIALTLALAIVELTDPMLENVADTRLGMEVIGYWGIIPAAMIVALVTGVIGGSYPALLLSSYEPVKALNAIMRSGKSSILFRRFLVVAQFAISIILVIGTLVMGFQMEHMRTKELGFDRDGLVYVKINRALRQQHEAVSNELRQLNGVTGVTWSASLPTKGRMGATDGFTWEGKAEDEFVFMNIEGVSYDFFETLGIEFVSGRSFSVDHPSDTLNVILNEAAVRATGLSSPIGKRFSLDRDSLGVVQGVVKDYHFMSLHTEIEPLVFWLRPGYGDYLLIRTTPENLVATIEGVEQTLAGFATDYPIECQFLDEAYADLYRSEARSQAMTNYGAVVAITISCLGLLGLASFMAERRVKEIGVRKILGASMAGIVQLISKEFVILVAAANLIAWPIAYYVMGKWLEGFSSRIEIGPQIFVLASLTTLALAWVTVSFQAIKAARANPVEALRYE